MIPDFRWMFAAGALLVAGPVLAQKAVESADDEVVMVADRVRTAFYERAPRKVRSAMQRALVIACEAARKSPPLEEDGKPLDIAPLCDEWVRADAPIYFREVLVTGPKLEEGWICVDPDLRRFQYVVDDILEDSHCVRAIFDYAGKRLTVDLSFTSAAP